MVTAAAAMVMAAAAMSTTGTHTAAGQGCSGSSSVCCSSHTSRCARRPRTCWTVSRLTAGRTTPSAAETSEAALKVVASGTQAYSSFDIRLNLGIHCCSIGYLGCHRLGCRSRSRQCRSRGTPGCRSRARSRCSRTHKRPSDPPPLVVEGQLHLAVDAWLQVEGLVTMVAMVAAEGSQIQRRGHSLACGRAAFQPRPRT